MSDLIDRAALRDAAILMGCDEGNSNFLDLIDAAPRAATATDAAWALGYETAKLMTRAATEPPPFPLDAEEAWSGGYAAGRRDGALTRERLTAVLRDYLPDVPFAETVADAILAALGAPSSPQGGGDTRE